MNEALRYGAAKRITLIGAAINLLLAGLKVFVGLAFHSHALVADGVHSFSDLLTDVLVLFASKFGFKGADSDHPYGHARIETLATVALAIIIIFVGCAIAYESIKVFYAGDLRIPGWPALGAALISIFANEGLYHWTSSVGRKIQSSILMANAWHHRSDAASSVVVLVGVFAALLGWPGIDALAAIVVGGFILKMGVGLAWSGLCELVDTGVEPDVLEGIKLRIQAVNGVQALHQLRTRAMGGAIFLDVHILVSPRLSVSEGHHIGLGVEQTLMAMSDITDVTVHVDPEDDELNLPCLSLPARETLLPQLTQVWEGLPGAKNLQNITLHYLASHIAIELYLPLEVLDTYTADALHRQYNASLSTQPDIQSVTLFFNAMIGEKLGECHIETVEK